MHEACILRRKRSTRNSKEETSWRMRHQSNKISWITIAFIRYHGYQNMIHVSCITMATFWVWSLIDKHKVTSIGPALSRVQSYTNYGWNIHGRPYARGLAYYNPTIILIRVISFDACTSMYIYTSLRFIQNNSFYNITWRVTGRITTEYKAPHITHVKVMLLSP